MKKGIRRAVRMRTGAFAAAAVLVLNQASAVFANTYDAAAQDPDLSQEACLLFPGDTISGLELPVYLNGDYERALELGENNSWTNKQVQELKNMAYRISSDTNDETGEAWYDITEEGCILRWIPE